MSFIVQPAPSLGPHQPAHDTSGRRIGSVVERAAREHVAVCACRQPMTPQGTHELAVAALRAHVRTDHSPRHADPITESRAGAA